MFFKIFHKITKCLAINIIFVSILEKIEHKNPEVFIHSNFSFIKILSSFENLETDQIKDQSSLELVMDMEESVNLDTFNQNNLTYDFNNTENCSETYNNSTNENFDTIFAVQLDFEKANPQSTERLSEDETKLLNNSQVVVGQYELVDFSNKKELESELTKLMKNERKLTKKLEQIEFIANIYSKAFLSDSSMSNTIKFIKKYELIKKLYRENRELIEKKKMDLEKYE